MLMASLGGQVLKTDHTCKVPAQIHVTGQEGQRLNFVKFLYVTQNELGYKLELAYHHMRKLSAVRNP